MPIKADLNKVCDILDKLTLDSLTLMEEYVAVKLDIEKKMCEGESHLAKSRYIMGQNSVSKLQLPSEDGAEFDAVTTVHVEVDPDSLLCNETRDLVVGKQTDNGDKDKEGSVFNPIRWFGVLVPRNLYYAQSKFKEALLSSVTAANLQTKLDETCSTIQQLEQLKDELINK